MRAIPFGGWGQNKTSDRDSLYGKIILYFNSISHKNKLKSGLRKPFFQIKSL